MQGFVFRQVPPRPTFAFGMDDDECATLVEYATHWVTLAAERAIAYGPVDDPACGYGLAVVLARTAINVRSRMSEHLA